MLERKEKPTDVYNPDSQDFEFDYCDDENVKQHYVLKSLRITTLPYYLTLHGAEKLADLIYWKRGDNSHIYENKIKDIMKEIMV